MSADLSKMLEETSRQSTLTHVKTKQTTEAYHKQDAAKSTIIKEQAKQIKALQAEVFALKAEHDQATQTFAAKQEALKTKWKMRLRQEKADLRSAHSAKMNIVSAHVTAIQTHLAGWPDRWSDPINYPSAVKRCEYLQDLCNQKL